MSLTFLLALFLTQVAPPGLAIQGFKLHVEISEDLPPDSVRALAQPGVTLWVTTRSNALKSSLIENLARASEAYVQMRSPLKRSDLDQLRQAPAVGLWVTDVPAGVVGPRPLAVSIEGPLREVRAQRVIWHPQTPPSLEEWGKFSALPGAKLVKLDESVTCVPGLPKNLVLFRRSTEIPNCVFGSRVRVPPTVSPETLLRLFTRDPAVELDVLVGANEDTAAQASRLRSLLAKASAGR